MSCSLRRRHFRLPLLAVAATLATAGRIPAQPEPMLVITFDPKLSIRELARDYLGDADLWPEILETSGIASIVELQPGQQLKVPVSQVKAANRAIQLSHGEIERANQAGAQLFAPRIITLAIGYYDEALIKRTLGAWLETFDLAQQSRASAGEAYAVCQRQRNRAVEARLSDEQGSVEGQKPDQLTWEDRELNALLVEEEKIRTLSGSTAQITFRDASRLRLNPNSQAVIQRLRVDPLTRQEDAKVSLIEGDFYALLADDSERKRFEVEIPGVEARVDSGDFWVSHDESGAKFTNYDAEPVRVTSGGEAVILGQNQGTLVAAGGEPMRKLDVLPAPLPQAPRTDRPAIAGQVVLRWTAVPEAVGYWLEIAHDPQFQRLEATHRGFAQPRFAADALAPGIYHWRVSALDRFGLPGARSDARRLEVRTDRVSPYLRVDEPEPGFIARQAPVVLAGRSEPGARLTIDDAAVEIDATGSFRHAVTPAAGANALLLRVVDRAGNETTRTLGFVYMPDRPAEVVYSPEMRRLAPRHFAVNGGRMSLVGKTLAHAWLRVGDEDGAALATAYADADGRFRVNVPLTKGHQELTLRITAPSGFVTPTRFAVTVDQNAPEILLDTVPPTLTTVPAVSIRGRLSEAATLRLNGDEVQVAAGRFARRIELADGDNRIELAATDVAGNVTLKRWGVRLDRAPPELVGHQITATTDAGRTALRMTVAARDASGLARVAPFTVLAAGGEASGYLRYDAATDRYQGKLDVSGTAQDARLRRVELTDSVGNSKIFSITGRR